MPFRTALRGRIHDGHDCKNRQGLKTAEVQGPAAQPLPPLRAPAAYLRKFALCRLCFRELALEGDIAGVTKSSW